MRTYGKIHLLRKTWFINAEPQVAIRLKRVFAKIGAGERGTLTLADSVDAGRDLAWFLQRYPMEISEGDREALEQREQQHVQLATDVARILSADFKPTRTPLALPLRDYQEQAVAYAKRVKRFIIADELGVGKTAQAIGIIADPACRPALVVCMTSLPLQWRRELERFLPGIRVHVLRKGRPYDIVKTSRTKHGQRDLFLAGGLPDVIILNYSKLAGWSEELAGKIRTVVFDECQELRRQDSDKFRAAKRISQEADIAFGLSGTPIYNLGGEAWNLYDAIHPGALGDWSEFATEWCEGYSRREKASLKDPKAFGSYLRDSGLMLRRTRIEVGRELPKMQTIEHTVDADTDEIDKVATAATELAKLIMNQGGSGFDKLKASEELSWKLRHATGVAKAFYVAAFVRLLVESGEKVLLFGWHREVYSLWEERLRDLNPVFFTGEETLNQKEAAKAAFVDGDAKILIMSLRSGAGIDGLQHVCRTVVFGEIDWAHGVHEQGIGRIHRDGQKEPVVAYFLLADCGSDPVVADVLGIKRSQLEGIRDPNQDVISKNTSDPDRMKKLAADFLRQRGEKIPEAEEAA